MYNIIICLLKLNAHHKSTTRCGKVSRIKLRELGLMRLIAIYDYCLYAQHLKEPV